MRLRKREQEQAPALTQGLSPKGDKELAAYLELPLEDKAVDIWGKGPAETGSQSDAGASSSTQAPGPSSEQATTLRADGGEIIPFQPHGSSHTVRIGSEAQVWSSTRLAWQTTPDPEEEPVYSLNDQDEGEAWEYISQVHEGAEQALVTLSNFVNVNLVEGLQVQVLASRGGVVPTSF